jgi:hypothetical protein
MNLPAGPRHVTHMRINRAVRLFGNPSASRRYALGHKFPISKQELAELARAAVASTPATVCPPGEHPSVVEKRLREKAAKD